MAGRVEVFARVLVWARIAAADVTAGQAHPQMRPRVLTALVALLALAGGKRLGLGEDAAAASRCSHVPGTAGESVSRPA